MFPIVISFESGRPLLEIDRCSLFSALKSIPQLCAQLDAADMMTSLCNLTRVVVMDTERRSVRFRLLWLSLLAGTDCGSLPPTIKSREPIKDAPKRLLPEPRTVSKSLHFHWLHGWAHNVGFRKRNANCWCPPFCSIEKFQFLYPGQVTNIHHVTVKLSRKFVTVSRKQESSISNVTLGGYHSQPNVH